MCGQLQLLLAAMGGTNQNKNRAEETAVSYGEQRLSQTGEFVENQDSIHSSLVEAAAHIFAESGFQGAKMQTIAQRADLSTGAIYNRFSGKSELLLQALRSHSVDRLSEQASSDQPIVDFIESLADSLLSPRDGLGSALLLEALVAARREPEIKTWLKPRLENEREFLSDLLTADEEAGLIAPHIQASTLVAFSQAVSLGMQMMTSIGIDMPERDSWNELIRRTIDALVDPRQ